MGKLKTIKYIDGYAYWVYNTARLKSVATATAKRLRKKNKSVCIHKITGGYVVYYSPFGL